MIEDISALSVLGNCQTTYYLQLDLSMTYINDLTPLLTLGNITDLV